MRKEDEKIMAGNPIEQILKPVDKLVDPPPFPPPLPVPPAPAVPVPNRLAMFIHQIKKKKIRSYVKPILFEL